MYNKVVVKAAEVLLDARHAVLRYNMRGGMFWKLSVNHYVVDAGSGGADPELNAARLEIGWGF